MLLFINKVLVKLMPIITPISVIFGIVFADYLHSFVFLVPWLFAFMTFTGSLGSKLRDLKFVIKFPGALIICLFILHIVMPLIAFGVGCFLFQQDTYTIIGLVIAFLIPTGVSSLIWVSIFKGNVILTLSIILIDSLLSPFIVPAGLHFFFQSTVHMNGAEMVQGLIWMIVFPSLLGMFLNEVSKGKIHDQWAPKLSPFSKIFLGAVVAINASAVAPYFKHMNSTLLWIAVTVFVLACLAYLLGWYISKIVSFSTDTLISLTFNSGMRNISAGAVIAITFFPPPVAVPVVIGMLFQQVLASIAGTMVSHRIKKIHALSNESIFFLHK